MNYNEAKAIAAAHAPDLIVDPPNMHVPALLSVRRVVGGPSHSLYIGDIDPAMYPPIEGKPAVDEVPAVPATDDHPGMPAIPAQPAIRARTTAGQVAEAEQNALKMGLDGALRMLP